MKSSEFCSEREMFTNTTGPSPILLSFSSISKKERKEEESKDFGPFKIIWTPHREDILS